MKLTLILLLPLFPKISFDLNKYKLLINLILNNSFKKTKPDSIKTLPFPV